MSRYIKRWRYVPFLLLATFIFPAIANGVNYTVSTYVGDGATPCDTTPNTLANTLTTNLWFVTSDAAGNLYYPDLGRGLICKIDTNGNVTRIGGNGTSGVGAENVQATSTTLDSPMQVAVDSSGNVYFTEYSVNGAVRKIATNGVISTIYNTARTGIYSGDNILAVNAAGNYPLAIAVSPSGEVYFGSYTNFRIFRIDSNGYIHLVAGTGTSGTTGDGGLATSATIPYTPGIAFDASGDIYLSQWSTCIRKINHITGIINTYAGTCGTAGHTGDGGLASAALINGPWGISIDATNTLYIGERTGHTVRAIDLNTGIIRTIAGIYNSTGTTNGLTSSALFNGPFAVALRGSDLYVADFFNSKMRKIAGAAATASGSAPTLSASANSIFRGTNSIIASGGSPGKITFYANGKKIAGCIGLTYSGSATCIWKPSQRGSVSLFAEIRTSGNAIYRGFELRLVVANRVLKR